MASQAAAASIPNTPDESKRFVLARYDERVAYYWTGSRKNKRWYKVTRLLMIVFGALVTLVSSLSSANFIGEGALKIAFAVVTPVLAASMAIIGGFSQSFQWGAAWSDMVITASHIEKERDRIAVTPADKLNPVQELGLLDDLVLKETQGFFQRLFGAGGPANNASKAPAE